MASSEIIVGLDIGTTKIAVIVGRKNEYDKVEILGHGKTLSLGVRRGVVANIENTVQSIKAAVEEACLKSGVDIKYVNVGIAGQHMKSLQHRGSIIRKNIDTEISQDDIDNLHTGMFNLNMNPGEEIIDVIPQEYIVDGESGIKQPIGMLGNSLEANFHIIIGQTAAAKNIYKCVKKAGLEVVDLILEPMASADAVLSEEEKEAGVVMVDIGGGTSDVAIFQDGIIRHTAVIPLGGDIVTEDVREGCSIIKKHAEDLKIKYGSALASENKETEIVAIPSLRGRPPREISLKNLASIIQARMEEIIEHIYFEIRHSGYEKKLIGGIVLTGGGSQLKHIAQLTEYMTGMDTRIGYPNEHLSPDIPKEMASPMYATGIGLVLIGMARYEKDKARNKPVVEETAPAGKVKPPKQKKEKEKKPDDDASRKFTDAFIEKIKNWFESEAE
ncbi:MAG: cell division protein FtsA [Bacteroidetes bacterium]|nr:cell division protein FtsA [Bacteroidota bacterium]